MLGEGDLDPVTLLPMTDVNPRYVPRVLKPLPFVANGVDHPGKDKGKGKARDSGSGILSFFGPNPIIPPAKSSLPKAAPAKPSMVVGKASGKRSLAAEMDRDIAAKRNKREIAVPPPTQSRFFGPPISPSKPAYIEVDSPLVAGPSRLAADKENFALDDANQDEMDLEAVSEADLEWDSLSLVVQAEVAVEEMVMDVEEPGDTVEQEDGYISPTPSRSRDADDLSSPLRPSVTPPPRKRAVKREREVYDGDFGVDAVSSPPEERRGRLPALSLCRSRSQSPPVGAILVAASPEAPRTVLVGPDLRDAFGDERTSDIDCFEDDVGGASGSTPTPSPSPLTPVDGVGDVALLVDPEELEAQASVVRTEAVAAGWRDRWGWGAKGKGRETPTLKRRETTVTPAGRHLPINARRPHPYLTDAPSSVPAKSAGKARPLQTRRSLTFLDPVRPAKPTKGRLPELTIAGDSDDDVVAKAQIRLAQFRCPP
ncbi:hypothetical protein B0H10DRAFT_319752 [Mycena sp. CBHHK59/15]|nr:hypothetical protein B0H10DRAFT_319752 [Mycena sp. CBHHK59/15]